MADHPDSPVSYVEIAVPSEADLRAATDPATGRMTTSWAIAGYKTVIRDEHRATYGHQDLVLDDDASVSGYADQKYRRKVIVLALTCSGAGPDAGLGDIPTGPAGVTGLPMVSALAVPGSADTSELEPLAAAVVGFAFVVIPDADNTHLIEIDLLVARSHRGRGIGSRLMDEVLQLAAANDRTHLIGGTMQEPRPPQDSDLVPPNGFGRLSTSPTMDFLLRRGFVLEQCERMSMLQTPVAQDVIDGWIADARSHGADAYRTTTWIGPTPDTLLDDLAALQQRMSVDVPLADLQYEEEHWDADRIRGLDAETERSGHTFLRTIAHAPDGSPAGFTVLEIPVHRIGFCYQNETLVHGEHRGHRLGLYLKALNLAALQQHRGDVRRIHTWNAGENAHMLAINDLMGFRTSGWDGAVQRVLSSQV